MVKPLPLASQTIGVANKQIAQSWEKFCIFIGSKELDRRKNWLTKEDLDNLRKVVKKGDIILTAQYRTIGWATLIRDITNHATYYAGNDEIIHARHGGVQAQSLEWLAGYYDGFFVLRMKDYEKNKELIPKIDEWIRDRLGADYNYAFKEREDSFVCTQFINDAYRQAGYDTNLTSFERPQKMKKVPLLGILKAAKFLTEGEFDVILMSHSYIKDKKEILIQVPQQKKRLKRFLFRANLQLK